MIHVSAGWHFFPASSRPKIRATGRCTVRLRSSRPASVHVEAPHGPHVLVDRGLLAAWFIRYRLDQEIERARRYDRPLAVLRAEFRGLDGERPTDDALAVAVAALHTASRATDLAGWDDSGAILVLMPETIPETARVAAARWRNEIWLRTRALGGQRWDITLLDWRSPATGERPPSKSDAA